MKNIFTLLLSLVLISTSYGNGIAVIDASQGTHFQLLETHVDVSVNNQISVTKTTQIFKNNSGTDTQITFAFPLPESAATTNIRWKINGIWTDAVLTSSPQDSSLDVPSGSVVNQSLVNYLGRTPLYFKLDDVISDNNTIEIELTYVELLKYSNNIVEYHYTNDYSLIQNTPLNSVSLSFHTTSQRDIVSAGLVSHDNATVSFTGTTQADIVWNQANMICDENFLIEYELNPNQLGLLSFSTFLPNSVHHCDTASGFFALVVEPDGTNNAAVINKVFTLIVDVSGSMSGNKIVQARDAATFIVNNMNPGDQFNIVPFSTTASSWQPNHVDYTAANETSALNYISNLESGGGTNFTNAFNIAIPQFTYDTSVANIIIFLTDGQANENNDTVLNNLSSLVSSNNLEENLQIHTFGIGTNVNNSLLSQIATQYNGIASFVGDSDLYDELATFYSYIQNPVLLDVQASFSPSTNIFDVYPNPFSNLYKGQQLIILGRYNTPDSIQATFSGQTFSNNNSFQYDFALTDSLIVEHQFLTKIWAKMKIDNLMRQYYNAGNETILADSLENLVTSMSICYGVVSPFTSYQGFTSGNGNSGNSGSGNSGNLPTGGSGSSSGFLSNRSTSDENSAGKSSTPSAHVFPNPFHEKTSISFFSNSSSDFKEIICRIYDDSGKIIKTIIRNQTSTNHLIVWDGSNDFGGTVPTGIYIYSIEIDGEQRYLGKIMKVE